MVGDDIRDDVLGAQAAGFKVLFNTKANTVCMHVYNKIIAKYFNENLYNTHVFVIF